MRIKKKNLIRKEFTISAKGSTHNVKVIAVFSKSLSVVYTDSTYGHAEEITFKEFERAANIEIIPNTYKV